MVIQLHLIKLYVYIMRDNIYKYSNPAQAQRMAYTYLGRKNGKLFRSTRKEKIHDKRPKNG